VGDVRDGKVSIQAAARDYGVAITESDLTVDDKATVALRRRAAQ
jgi:hypothetical protein